MIPDLKLLKDKKDDLHLAEIGAWLHDMGKCSDKMITLASWDKPPEFGYKPKKEYINLIGLHEIELFGKKIILGDLIEKGIPFAARCENNEEWIFAALGRAHGSAHIEKEEALTQKEKQNLDNNIKSLKKYSENYRKDASRKRELSKKLEKEYNERSLKLKCDADSLDEKASKLDEESDCLLLKIKSVHQSKNDTRLSNPFGYENRNICGLTQIFTDLLNQKSDNIQYIIDPINKIFKNALGETRRPTNEITLADWSSIVAALFKSALAGALLKQKLDNPNDFKWRFMCLRFDSEAIWGAASSIPILSARKNWLVEGLNRAKTLIEEDYYIGNEVYRDENGSIYVVPDIPDLLEIKDSSNGKSLGNMISERLDLKGEIVVSPSLDHEIWWGQNPEGYPDKDKDKIPPIADIISNEPYSPADASIVQSWWQMASGNPEVCTVSSLRPSGWGKGARRRVSDYWAHRILGRAREWFALQDTTIWIDEVADVNGRICLMVGRFDLSDWLSPDGHIKSLLVKPPDGNPDAAISKTPSFARLRRIWETTRAFWMDIEKDIEGSEIAGCVGPRLKIDGNFKSETKRNDIREFNAYEAEVASNAHPSSGIRLSIFYAGNNSFTVIDNLQRLAIKMDAPSEILKTYKASAEYVKNHLTGKLIIYDQEIISKEIGEFSISNVIAESESFLAAVPILSEPSKFMAIVPASKAMKVAKHIQEKYDREMGKVKNRLPITLGMVFAKSHTPLAALIDAGTRMLDNRSREERWPINDNAQITGSDCIIKFENKITWRIPVKMGDGNTDDVWYPNFYLDGCPTNGRPTMFHVNESCLVHAKELKKGDRVRICLSRFDFEFLDSASRRFEVSYDKESGKRRDKIRSQRPYLLDELGDFERMWKTISEELSSSQIKEAVGLIETKRDEWNLEADDTVFKSFVNNVIQNANWIHGKPANVIELEEAALSGKLRDIVELYMDILKLNGPVKNERDVNEPN